MAGKGVSFIKQQTPSFIAQFKEKVGYVEGPDIDTKSEKAKPEGVDDVDRQDEKPVVVLADGVDQTEADAFLAKVEQEKLAKQKERDQEEELQPTKRGKILFKKPEKRKTDQEKYKNEDKYKLNKKAKKTSSMKQVKDRKLLSFDDEDDG